MRTISFNDHLVHTWAHMKVDLFLKLYSIYHIYQTPSIIAPITCIIKKEVQRKQDCPVAMQSMLFTVWFTFTGMLSPTLKYCIPLYSRNIPFLFSSVHVTGFKDYPFDNPCNMNQQKQRLENCWNIWGPPHPKGTSIKSKHLLEKSLKFNKVFATINKWATILILVYQKKLWCG